MPFVYITYSVIKIVSYTLNIPTSGRSRALWVTPSVDFCKGRPSRQGLREKPQQRRYVEDHQEMVGSAKGAESGKRYLLELQRPRLSQRRSDGRLVTKLNRIK